MSWRNVLCTDPNCHKGCWHLGPQGQQCFYNTEQKLCELLGIPWRQDLDLDHLLSMIRDKLASLPGPEDYAGQIKLAEANVGQLLRSSGRPIHPASLTAIEEDKDAEDTSR